MLGRMRHQRVIARQRPVRFPRDLDDFGGKLAERKARAAYKELQATSAWDVACLRICSVTSRNLRNLEIALRILGIRKLHANLVILRPCKTFVQSRDCARRLHNLEIARVQFANVMD